ncbi:DUF1080 domain-containing protein [Sorangium sp. So ce1014]|uniref:3-keto-disaccharide hydrolase n=1 Tax=Sorangium sp. So ce1014 TaxID=3133326 RepID=UPI003F5F38D2
MGKMEDGAIQVVAGAGDILSAARFGDALIHLEFQCSDMPHATGQATGNSGMFLQIATRSRCSTRTGSRSPATGDCCAMVGQLAPLSNACWPALAGQSYDIVFRAARVSGGGEVVEPARLTLLHNGVVIYNNVTLRGPTEGAIDEEDEGARGPLRLQDHGDPVRYRNIWLVRLAPRGSERYEPG